MGMKATISTNLTRLDRVIPQLYAAQDEGSRIQLRAYRARIISTDSVASKAFLISTGIRETMRTDSRRTKEVGSDLIQALIMEDGRRRGARMPPVDAILQWMPFRGLGNDRSRAFAIAVNIGRRGIKGRKILKQAFDETKDLVVRTIERAIEKWLARNS
jgi:hypothetical protein